MRTHSNPLVRQRPYPTGVVVGGGHQHRARHVEVDAVHSRVAPDQRAPQLEHPLAHVPELDLAVRPARRHHPVVGTPAHSAHLPVVRVELHVHGGRQVAAVEGRPLHRHVAHAAHGTAAARGVRGRVLQVTPHLVRAPPLVQLVLLVQLVQHPLLVVDQLLQQLLVVVLGLAQLLLQRRAVQVQGRVLVPQRVVQRLQLHLVRAKHADLGVQGVDRGRVVVGALLLLQQLVGQAGQPHVQVDNHLRVLAFPLVQVRQLLLLCQQLLLQRLYLGAIAAAAAADSSIFARRRLGIL